MIFNARLLFVGKYGSQWCFNRVCFVAAVLSWTSELTSEPGGKPVDRLSRCLIFFLGSGAPAASDTKKVDRRQRQSRSMDIKGITETSLMWFPAVVILICTLLVVRSHVNGSRGGATRRQKVDKALSPSRPRFFLLSKRFCAALSLYFDTKYRAFNPTATIAVNRTNH